MNRYGVPFQGTSLLGVLLEGSKEALAHVKASGFKTKDQRRPWRSIGLVWASPTREARCQRYLVASNIVGVGDAMVINLDMIRKIRTAR